MTTLDAAVAAANRLLNYDGDNDRREEDVQLVAGVMLELGTQPRWRSSFRRPTPGGSYTWLRIPADLIVKEAA